MPEKEHCLHVATARAKWEAPTYWSDADLLNMLNQLQRDLLLTSYIKRQDTFMLVPLWVGLQQVSEQCCQVVT